MPSQKSSAKVRAYATTFASPCLLIHCNICGSAFITRP
jgi:ribosomal protein S27E